ncbi:MAG: hypothetical protein QNK37_18060 [Acidobacteriota bacterium]|nr:hypothetical protein [Acidobacteriota bacterium]
MLLLYLCFLSYQIDLETFDAALFSNIGSWEPGNLAVLDEGFLVTDRKKVYHFDHQGRQIQTVEPDYDPYSMSFALGRLIVSGVKKKERRAYKVTESYKDGIPVQRSDHFFRSLHRVEDTILGTQFKDEFRRGNYPPVFYKLDPETLEAGEPRFKVPLEVVEAPGYSKAFWVVNRGDLLIFMGPAVPRLYFYTELIRQKEFRLGESTEGITPYLDLNQDRPLRPPNAPLPERFTYVPEAQVLLNAKRFRYSDNLFFGKVGNGYVVCFEVPDRLDGIYIGNHLGIQFLDERFQPRGGVIERFGQIMGAHNGKVYVFYPGGKKEYLDRNISVRAHYNNPDVDSMESLIQLISRYRKGIPRRYTPYIEIIEPPS